MSVPVEHTWFLARYVRDDMRGETRNVGVILRAANLVVPKVRFLDPVSFLLPDHTEEWRGWKTYWEGAWEKHGNIKPFYWLCKRSDKSPHLFWDLAGSRMASLVDFDQMFDLLVKPESR